MVASGRPLRREDTPLIRLDKSLCAAAAAGGLLTLIKKSGRPLRREDTPHKIKVCERPHLREDSSHKIINHRVRPLRREDSSLGLQSGRPLRREAFPTYIFHVTIPRSLFYAARCGCVPGRPSPAHVVVAVWRRSTSARRARKNKNCL